MSFILDALRKSDAERQRAATPGLADIRYSQGRGRRSWWLPLLVVVLVANLGFMAVQFLRRPAAPTSAPAVAVPGTVPELPPVATAPLPGNAPEVRPLAAEAELDDGVPVAAAGDVAGAGAPLTSSPAAPAPPVVVELDEAPGATAPAPALEGSPAPRVPEARIPAAMAPGANRTTLDLPTNEQLVAAGTLRVPELNLDLHVYNAEPARRFVRINGNRYGEGATLREGPAVVSITADGVVLDSQGTRFILRPK